MQIKQLWQLPILSSDLEKEIKFEVINADAFLIVKHDTMTIKIKFETTLCHIHTSEKFTKNMLNAYDMIVEIEDSEWVNEIKELNPSVFEILGLKHYAIYLEKMGMYQFIASNYEIDKVDTNE